MPVFQYLPLYSLCWHEILKHPIAGSITFSAHSSSALWTPGQRASPSQHIPHTLLLALQPRGSLASAEGPRTLNTWEQRRWRMAALWKSVASGLLVALGLTLLGWRAEAQKNGRDKVRLHVPVTVRSNAALPAHTDTFIPWAVVKNEDSHQFRYQSSLFSLCCF